MVADSFENNQMGNENQKDEQEECYILFTKNIQIKSVSFCSLANAAPLVIE